MRIFSYLFLSAAIATANPLEVSGIYPSLAMFNKSGECGTGAVVPWANRLWVITYAPHEPHGSTDKLYEITPDLKQLIRPESVGGTPANRMIHKESNQLFIGPYAIDGNAGVRVIKPSMMFGRLTANARHLFDPAGKIYYATMEEGIYEVDVKTLAVTELWRDEQKKDPSVHHADFPGYHGKGLYSGQGVLIYANNGEYGRAAETKPETPSGILAEWDGKAEQWKIIRRNQFTEVTGPGGITGNPEAPNDPIWTIGWDYRSLILMCRYKGEWHSYRLPKGSHSYDGAHGWNTEWPRIREIGEGNDLLMTMHGTFWKFPKTFTPENSAGIAPRSNYLKVIGDFTKWNDRVVFGCDDTASAEFLNSRKAKGKIAAPQSQSNLWFVNPSQLDQLGPVIGRGAVWANDAVKAGEASDPYLFSGYDHRGLHLTQNGSEDVVVEMEIDKVGNGKWESLGKLTVPAGKEIFHAFGKEQTGTWIRLKSASDIAKANAVFTYRNDDTRQEKSDSIFNGIAKPGDTAVTGGLVRALAKDRKTLGFAAAAADGTDIGYYELDADLKLAKKDDAEALAGHKEQTALAQNVLTSDAASVIFVDDDGKRWRLPKGDSAFESGGTFGNYRVDREIATERDLFNSNGTFFELPARNAGGFSRIRPVATHNLMLQDFCSYRGLLVISGISKNVPSDNGRIIRSDDGKTALWVGAIDDIWKLGKPRGKGGPWKDAAVKSGEKSDPYLMTAYDKKSLSLSSDQDTTITIEVDLSGDGSWVVADKIALKAGTVYSHDFPSDFSAYWIRFTSDRNVKASAQLSYD